MSFCQILASFDHVANICTILGFVVAICATFYIPRRIMVNQTYAAFWDAYRSPEMGGAILSLMHFFKNACHGDISQINAEYKKRYDSEIKDKLGKPGIDFEKTLHFQRRLVSYWYWQLAKLRYDYGIAGLTKRQLKKDFTEDETHLLSLIYHMGPVAKECFEDISRIREPDDDQDGVIPPMLYRLCEESEGWG